MSWFGDVGYAVRSLRKNRGFALAAVLTLALGIGANTAIYSVVDAVLLRPLPYREPGRLAVVWEKRTREGTRTNAIAPADYLYWLKRNHSFQALDAEDQTSVNLTGDGKAERLVATIVTSGFVPTYGIAPLLGRAFTAEDQSGNGHAAMLSYGLWQSHFGGNPHIVGRAIRLNDEPYRIAGVMPAGFRFFFGRPTDVFLPLVLTPQDKVDHGGHRFLLIGRLRPTVDLAQAGADMDLLSRQIEKEHPESNTGHSANLIPLDQQLTSEARPLLLILMGTAGAILLIACANVANLLLARANQREREMTIRRALGAGGMHMIRLVLSESLVLAAAGGSLGILLARACLSLTRFVPARVASDLPGFDHIAIDRPVLFFAFVVSIVAVLLFGFAPMLRRTPRSYRGNRVAGALVIGEVALASTLLIAAALLMASFSRLLRIDPGFQSARRLSLELSLPQVRYHDLARQRAFYAELLDHVGQIPSVDAAAITTLVPGHTWGPRWGLAIEEHPRPRTMEEWPKVSWRIVSDRLHDTMGIPILRGRGFTSADTAGSVKVALLSQATVDRYWPGRDPVGSRIALAHDPTWRTVVGITGSVKYLGLDRDPAPELYLPLSQMEVPGLDVSLVVRSRSDAALLAIPVERIIHEIDPNLPVSDVKTIDSLLAESTAPRRFNAILLGLFCALACLLAFGGLYSTLLYLVSQRVREMGLRLALGAQRRDLIGLLLGEGGRLALVGIAIGCLAAASLSRVLKSLVFGLSPLDPATYALVAIGMLVTAALGSLIPAWRASRVDPMAALRSE